MDSQLKKGLLEVIVLATLVDEDSYGYKIVQNVNKLISVSESTLYPILRRLEKNSCLATYSMNYNSRLRKYYKITKNGHTKISEFLDESDEIEKIFNFIKQKSNKEKE